MSCVVVTGDTDPWSPTMCSTRSLRTSQTNWIGQAAPFKPSTTTPSFRPNKPPRVIVSSTGNFSRSGSSNSSWSSTRSRV
jgi:hypothetical protein